MTAPIQDTPAQDPKVNDKELNFRQLEQRYKLELEKERSARIEAERAVSMSRQQPEDDEDDEPYVNNKKLQKKLAQFGEQTQKATQTEIQRAVHGALQEERRNTWLKQNNDFYDVLKHADKLAIKDPELAETILEMPEGFERQKLVYKNIKALGLDKPEQKQPSIQEKIDANRRSPYYQPSGVATSPYAAQGDFSPAGQKNAFDHMMDLKNKLRL